MRDDIQFSRDLIKGKIAEVIFEQMFREAGEFTILRLGYEYTTPELAQYQNLIRIKRVLENLRHTPDFALISHDKSRVFIVEVKYRTKPDLVGMKRAAQAALKFSDPSCLFVASPDGFHFDYCNNVVNHNGEVNLLKYSWVSKPIQEKYLKLLLEFER